MIGAIRLTLLTLVLAGLVHIFAVLSTPFLAEDKVWQRISATIPERRMVPFISTHAAESLLGEADPAMAHAVCRLSLDDGPATVVADGPTGFWNVTIYNRQAEALYSLHDGVSEIPLLNLTIRRPDQARPSETQQAETTQEAPPLRVVDGLPLPLARESALQEEDVAGEGVIEDENRNVDVVLDENEIFLIFRIFRSSRYYDNIVAEALQTAQCN